MRRGKSDSTILAKAIERLILLEDLMEHLVIDGEVIWDFVAALDPDGVATVQELIRKLNIVLPRVEDPGRAYSSSRENKEFRKCEIYRGASKSSKKSMEKSSSESQSTRPAYCCTLTMSSSSVISRASRP